MNDAPKAPAAAGAFDAAAWREHLLALNPWAHGLAIAEYDETFVVARRTATLKRYAQGKEVWNAWANSVLALKKALEESGEWTANSRGGQNSDTQFWFALATTVFSTDSTQHTFEANASFNRFLFPSDAWFEKANFGGDVQFEGASFSGNAFFDFAAFTGIAVFNEVNFALDAWFERATFSHNAWFEQAAFCGNAEFERVTFSAKVSFESSTLSGFAQFKDVAFAGETSFEKATFSEVAWFEGATFDGEATFGSANFSGVASFDGVTFGIDTSFDRTNFESGSYFYDVRFIGSAEISQARFRGPVALDGSIFGERAGFEAIDSQAAFSLADATFHLVPSFIGATFKGTLRLDNVATPKYRLLGWTPDRNASAHFRELKRRAVEAQDRDRELEFFAQEIRTARFHAKRLPSWVPRIWSWRFWFGLAYGTFSNFGRSFLRPLIVWLALVAGFAVFYLGQHEAQHNARKALAPDGRMPWVAAYVRTARSALAHPPKCVAPNAPVVAKTDIVKEALFLSASNALVVFNVGRGDVSRRTYGCLFGFEQTGGAQAPPIIPYRVAVASTLQTLASAILIFLFLLAVRNLLRLK